MARTVTNLIFLMLFSTTCCRAYDFTWGLARSVGDTLKPGDILNSSSCLVSASGNFIMAFSKPVHLLDTYLCIWRNDSFSTWNANRLRPLLYPQGVLSWDEDGRRLRIIDPAGDPISLFKPSESTDYEISNTSTLMARLLDDGNLVVQELDVYGSTKVLWQSFDSPADTLLPGMKLGINHRTSRILSLESWSTENSQNPGAFSLEWDSYARQLQMSHRGVLYWRSGVFTDGGFEFVVPDASWNKRYKFTMVSNEDEDSLSFENTGVREESDVPSMWWLSPTGKLMDREGRVYFGGASGRCNGYSTDGGCQEWPQPGCRNGSAEFEFRTGYFTPSNYTTVPYLNTSLIHDDCEALCWTDCDCVAFNTIFLNYTGCTLWRGVNLKFVEHNGGLADMSLWLYIPNSNHHIGTNQPPNSNHNGTYEEQFPSRNGKQKWIWFASWIGATVLALLAAIGFYFIGRRNSCVREPYQIHPVP